MSSNISNFEFDSFPIRILVEDGEPLFCATDVCLALGYGNPRDALKKHAREGGVAKRDTPTSSGIQPLSYIDERNLYRLIMRSKLESAERFQDWVCGEVLPSIRKTGQYAKPYIPKDYPEALIAYANEIKAHLASEEHAKELELKIEEDKPLVEFAQDIKEDDKVGIKIALAAKLLQVSEFKILRPCLRRIGWMRLDKAPAQSAINTGYMTFKQSVWIADNGQKMKSTTPLITGKGMAKLHEILSSQCYLKDGTMEMF
jgi:prophage antirepressor-like protein